MTLRPYQQQGIAQIRAEYGQGKKRVIYQAPTGAGKTVLFCHMVAGSLAKGKRCFVLVHRQELLLQASRELLSNGIDHGLIWGQAPMEDKPVQVCSVQTLARRVHKVPAPDFIIIDEAHHSVANTYDKILSAYPGAHVLGVTATPKRCDGKGLIGAGYESLIEGPAMADLIADGYLSPYRLFVPPNRIDYSQIRRQYGDWKAADIAMAAKKAGLTGDAVEHYKKIAMGQKGIAFCVNLEEASRTVAEFNAAGIPAEQIDGSMSDSQRQGVIERFSAGKTLILVSVELINEGFNVPDATVAILLRPTESLTIYLQQVGRVLRWVQGKVAIILDHANNSRVFGPPCMKREWTLDGKTTTTESVSQAGKTCGQCFCYVPGNAATCPNCGNAFTGRERELIIKAGELVEVDIKTLEKQAKTHADLMEVAKRKGYRRPELYADLMARKRGLA